MQLCDFDINHLIVGGTLVIDPFEPRHLQPASLDIRLGDTFVVEDSHHPIDYRGKTLVIHPQQFILGHSLEVVKVPNHIAARVEGKSTWGRCGLMVHITAGFIDPGFQGQITLELLNVGHRMLRLTPGEPIAQLSFHQLTGPALRPYGSPGLGSHYQGQMGPTIARKE